MKRWLCCLCTIFALCGTIRAQEDIQKMLTQIAKLEIYITKIEKGYQIAKEGLTTISQITNGEFNLHSLFFTALQTVNPSVKRYSKIPEIIADQLEINASFKRLTRYITLNGGFSESEMNCIGNVFENMSVETVKCIHSLTEVLTDGNLQMTDDERISRIDELYSDMKDKYVFTKTFVRQNYRMIQAREQDEHENQILKSME